MKVTEVYPGIFELTITHLTEHAVRQVVSDLRMIANIDALKYGHAFCDNVCATWAIEECRRRAERAIRERELIGLS